MKLEGQDNLSSKAYEKIKQMILSGELKQGQGISINAMADVLKISRTPITNACQRLEYEKLLTIMPKKGVVINTISLEAACGIYELRAAIESYNAKRIMEHLTEEDIKILKDSIEKQIKCEKQGDRLGFMNEDMFFHRYILEKDINFELLSVVNQLYDRAYILGAKNSEAARMIESIEEHKYTVEMIKKKDKQAFVDAVEKNILNGFNNLVAKFLR